MCVKKILALCLALCLAGFGSTIFAASLSGRAGDGGQSCYYLLQGSYSESEATYTIALSLVTDTDLAAGTLGIRYDAVLDENVSFALNENNFSIFNNFYDDPRLDPNLTGTEHPEGLLLFQWTMNDIADRTGKIEMGTITVNNVTSLEAWYTDTFRVQNWMGTSISKLPEFTREEDDIGYCLNDQIWRKPSLSELQTDPNLIGWYQGYDTEGNLGDLKNNPLPGDVIWYDIGFQFESQKPLKVPEYSVSGTLKSWNPNNRAVVYLIPMDGDVYDDTDLSYRFEGEGASLLNGRVTTEYTIPRLRPGRYAVMAEKEVHLTYQAGGYAEIAGGDQKMAAIDQPLLLYCGDITGDGLIRLNDRALLLRYLHTQSYSDTDGTAVRSDLNGDGRVTIADLNILKMYFNQKY